MNQKKFARLRRSGRYIGSLFLFLMTFPYPSYSRELSTFYQVSMGTVAEITLIGENREQTEKAAFQAFYEMKKIEQLMSPKIEKGDVLRINRSAGKEWVDVSSETFGVVKRSIEISELSEGRFDITVGPLIELWRKAKEKGDPPSEKDLKGSLDLIGFRNIMIHPDGKIF